MVHRDVAHGDVLHDALIHFLESQTAAIHEGAVAQGDVLISPVRFRAQLEAAAYPAHRLRNVTAIEQRTQLVTRNHTVGDGDMLGNHRLLQGVGTFQHQGIIARRIDLAVGYGEILAAVDVEAITIGIDGYIIHSAQFASRQDDAEMTATIDGDITNQDVAAELEGNRLIARSDVAAVHHTTFLGILLGQSQTVNHATTGDGNIFLSDGIDKTVLEIRMAAILVSRAFPRFSLIVCLHLGRSRQNLGTSRKM